MNETSLPGDPFGRLAKTADKCPKDRWVDSVLVFYLYMGFTDQTQGSRLVQQTPLLTQPLSHSASLVTNTYLAS